MIGFEISVNNSTPVIAGVEPFGVMEVKASSVRRQGGDERAPPELRLHVAGLKVSGTGDAQHLSWVDSDLREGDTVTIRVKEFDQPHVPSSVRPEPWAPTAEDLPELLRKEIARKEQELEKLRQRLHAISNAGV